VKRWNQYTGSVNRVDAKESHTADWTTVEFDEGAVSDVNSM
jgi:hypothetical protein